MRIAINGFGRIGRNFFRAALKDEEFLENFEIEKPVAGLEMNIEKLLP